MDRLFTGAVYGFTIAANFAPVPFVAGAASAVQAITESCMEVSIHKQTAKRLSSKCTELMAILQDENVEGTEVQEYVDRVAFTLEKVKKKVQSIARMSRVISFIRNRDVERELQSCISDVDTAMNSFQVGSHVALHRAQRTSSMVQSRDNAEIIALLREITTNPSYRREVGEQRAEVMAIGQEELRHMRTDPSSQQLNTIDATKGDGITRVAQIEEFQHLLLSLNIPPSVTNLNGEVAYNRDQLAEVGGPHTDIRIGMWMGEKRVAVKSLRMVQTSEKAKSRFVQEIRVWSQLSHQNILPFYGLLTDGPNIAIVSPWQDNGNLENYVKARPEANRLNLLYGAALGLEYLHCQSIVHGNVKCSNVLISAGGVPSICDFGLSKVVEDVTDTAVNVTLAQFGGMRWLGPEVLSGSAPQAPSDVYSFAMTILECLTLKKPFAEKRVDLQVLLGVIGGTLRPQRPVEREVGNQLSDELWELMMGCWETDPGRRPVMVVVVEWLYSFTGGFQMEM